MNLFEALKYIRMSLVPEEYEPHPFRSEGLESMDDMRQSIFATYRFRQTVSKCIDSEIDSETGKEFHEHEDHCHILKGIWKHTQEGPPGANLQGFDDAMQAVRFLRIFQWWGRRRKGSIPPLPCNSNISNQLHLQDEIHCRNHSFFP